MNDFYKINKLILCPGMRCIDTEIKGNQSCALYLVKCQLGLVQDHLVGFYIIGHRSLDPMSQHVCCSTAIRACGCVNVA